MWGRSGDYFAMWKKWLWFHKSNLIIYRNEVVVVILVIMFGGWWTKQNTCHILIFWLQCLVVGEPNKTHVIQCWWKLEIKFTHVIFQKCLQQTNKVIENILQHRSKYCLVRVQNLILILQHRSKYSQSNAT